MAVPKRRTTSARRDMRRAQHDKVTPPNVVECPVCSAPRLAHRVCKGCGHYGERQVLGTVPTGQG